MLHIFQPLASLLASVRFTPLRLAVSRIGLSNGIFRSYDSILRAGGKRRFTRWRARATARASLVD